MKKYGLLFHTLLMTHACVLVNFNLEAHHKFDPISAKISGKTAAIAIGALVAAKIVYDVSWHNASAAQASSMYQQLEAAIQENQIESINDAALSTLTCKINCKNLLIYQSWMQSSYNSLIKPWNWTSSQKHAFNQLKVLEALVLYADLIALYKNPAKTVTSNDLSLTLRAKFMAVSRYPLISSYQALQDSINFIASKEHDFCSAKINKLLYEMVPYLIYFKTILGKDEDYILERQTKRFHEILINVFSQNFD